MKQPSVRVRFTLWYTAALAAIIILFSSGTYLFVADSFKGYTDRQLRQHAATIEKALRHDPKEVAELIEYGSSGIFRVMDGDSLFAATASWREGCLDLFPAPGETDHPRSWKAPNGRHYRLHSAVVSTPGHGYRVTVAIDEAPIHRLLDLLAIIEIVGVPAAILLALIGGYLLAGRVLAPVSAITAKAREITAERLSERLPVENPDDEFGSLATVFNRTFARLEDSFERMRRFTADASHELRTPLTAIRSVGEVGLRRNSDADSCRETIASMLEEADRLTRLVDSLMTLSRADSGAISVQRQAVELNLLAADVIDCMQVLAEEKGQELSLDAREPVVAEVDPAILRQALINLVDNAVKYTPANGRIRVAVRRASAGESVIEVIDNGSGIPKEHQANIFDRFYRVDKGRSRETGGVGLGLAIARWAVEANGGRIEVESEEGKGSTFRIILPA
jgi:heavy metal sensor kinase